MEEIYRITKKFVGKEKLFIVPIVYVLFLKGYFTVLNEINFNGEFEVVDSSSAWKMLCYQPFNVLELEFFAHAMHIAAVLIVLIFSFHLLGCFFGKVYIEKENILIAFLQLLEGIVFLVTNSNYVEIYSKVLTVVVVIIAIVWYLIWFCVSGKYYYNSKY